MRWSSGDQKALDKLMTPAQRPAYLSNARGDDGVLRNEGDSLIVSHEKDGSFIDSPAFEVGAELLIDEKSELKPGQTLASYEIISFISRGRYG